MTRTHIAACLLATVFAVPALAQTPAAPSASPAMPGSTMMAPAPSATMPGAPTKVMTKIEHHQLLASELIGTKVISANNESVGDINDVVLDRNGQTVAAIVGVGGFLGIGEKDVAVPFAALEFATREQVSAMTKKNAVTTTGSTTGTVNAPAPSATTTTTTATTDDGEPERVILRMTKAELQAAPAFDTDRDSTKSTSTSGSATPMAPVTPAPKP
ncbi:PRC-barrel domain-containing protein [Microvirga antarctica]|uniref:PRC-barrel domain-containing protein n=1 Tax=Microvirga antarctica TaxID=2819233 RepID=UPI001B3111B9|nr:PRC-barrel domain-containing protein [Microvirga antarctica]